MPVNGSSQKSVLWWSPELAKIKHKHVQSNMQVIHAKVILEVDFQKGNQSSWKNKKKSEQLYAFIYEYSSLRCYPFKNLAMPSKGTLLSRRLPKWIANTYLAFLLLVPVVPHTHSSVRYLGLGAKLE